MLPIETQLDTEGNGFQRLLCVFGGHFDNLENDPEQVIDDINEVDKDTTVNYIYVFLKWWCYFILLDRSGVHSVKIQLPELTADEAGVFPGSQRSYAGDSGYIWQKVFPGEGAV